MSSPQKRGTSLLQEDLEEAKLGDLSPIMTRAAARRNAERLAALQQAEHYSPEPLDLQR